MARSNNALTHKQADTRFNCGRTVAIGFIAAAATSLSGCTVFGRHIDDGIWFPILLVVSFIAFLVWRVSAVSARPRSGRYTDNASYFDSGADGHAGHHQYLDGGGEGGDDGGAGGDGHGIH